MSYIPNKPPVESENWFNSLDKGKCTKSLNLKLGQQLYQLDAQLPYNRSKNRYSNISPYDTTRVVLKELEDGDGKIKGSDYINASYIQVPNCTQRYIATQAPIPNTIPDFWRMVWETRSPIIVVLTRQMEGPIRKYHTYWPSSAEQPLSFPDLGLQVDFISEIIHPLSSDLIVSKFTVFGTLPGDVRPTIHYVTQLRFEGWPDFGVPNHPSALLTLIDVYRLELAVQLERQENEGGEEAQTMLGPPIIHCSAGVGRTGTFCAVDSAISIMTSWPPAKSDLIVHIVNAFRQQRAYMVQSSSQFHFIYQTLHHFVQTRPDNYL